MGMGWPHVIKSKIAAARAGFLALACIEMSELKDEAERTSPIPTSFRNPASAETAEARDQRKLGYECSREATDPRMTATRSSAGSDPRRFESPAARTPL